MQNLIFLLIGWFLSYPATLSEVHEEPTVEVVKIETLQELMTRSSHQIEVINFWATWCKPCIKELPYFQTLHQKKGDQLNVTLISLDFAEHLDSKVLPFVKKKGLTTRILLLDEIDYNSWIDKVDPQWTGSIPATLVINSGTGQRKFVEGELDMPQIQAMINEVSKP